jgi:hypothetical protein
VHKIMRRLLLAAGMVLAAGTAQAVDDGAGRDWRPIGETAALGGITWEAVAALCPTDGSTPCAGKLGSVELKDWVWGTAPQVKDLLARYAPALLTAPGDSVGGFEYFTPAQQFQALFGITMHIQGCPTYQGCFNSKFTTGMTASVAAYGPPAVAIGAEVTLDQEFGQGGFRLFSPLHPNMGRGLWMWRPTGLGTPNVYANDDSAVLSTPGAAVAVANVLANDWASGQRATLANVSLSLLSSSVAGVWLDTSDASVRVDAGTAAGTYQLSYRICSLANPAYCDDAVVTVTVRSFPLVARNDSGSASMAAGGRAIANVLANDSVGNVVATPALVRLAQVSSTHPGVTLNLATGAVDVAAGTPNGTHVLVYSICEWANLGNCAQASATVMPYVIDAVDDSARGSSKTGGVVIANVLANDRFGGTVATLDKVTISLPAPLPYGITLNTSTGAVSVRPKTSSGLYTFAYRICETASPANCDQATVTLDLSGRDR